MNMQNLHSSKKESSVQMILSIFHFFHLNFLYNLVYVFDVLVFLGDTWKDGVGVDMKSELKPKGLTWGVG